MVEGDQEPGGGGVGLGDPVGVEGVLGEGDQGVPQAGAVVAGVAELGAGFPGLRVDVAACGVGGCGSGEGEEGGGEEGAVLGRAAAADPDPTGPVRGDRQGPAQVGGAFLPLQRCFEAAVEAVGVDDSTRCRPALVSSVASRDWAWRSISFSPRRRVQSPGGRSSTADTITSAWSGEQVPATNASRVRDSGPLRALARATRRLPSPRRRPARWVTQSPVDP